MISFIYSFSTDGQKKILNISVKEISILFLKQRKKNN